MGVWNLLRKQLWRLVVALRSEGGGRVGGQHLLQLWGDGVGGLRGGSQGWEGPCLCIQAQCPLLPSLPE